MSRQYGFSLRELKFKKVWNDFIPKILSFKRNKDSECVKCKLRDLCDACAGWAYLEKGDAQKIIEHPCKIAHLRAEIFKYGRGGENGKKKEKIYKASS